jgi:hypothetical protein
VGRPKKREEDKYRTPARSWKPPPELYEEFKWANTVNGETNGTKVLIRLVTAYVEKTKHEQKGKP